jgi:hypothetical protein
VKIKTINTTAFIILFMAALPIVMSCAVQHTVPITYIDTQQEDTDASLYLATRIRTVLNNRHIIAVLPFFNLNKRVTNLGRAVAVDLQSALLTRAGSYTVVERDLYGLTVEKELVFMMTGIMDKSTTVKLGRIYGANTLVVGHVYETDDYFKVIVKVLDTETAQIRLQVDSMLSRTTQRIKQDSHY